MPGNTGKRRELEGSRELGEERPIRHVRGKRERTMRKCCRGERFSSAHSKMREWKALVRHRNGVQRVVLG